LRVSGKTATEREIERKTPPRLNTN